MVQAIQKFNPSTGEYLWDVPVMSEVQIEEEVGKTKKAQALWAQKSLEERAKILTVFRKRLVKRMDEFIEIISLETGKTRMDAAIEIFMTSNHLKYLCSRGIKYLKTERRSVGLFKIKKAYVNYLPYGIVGIISPWNYPFILTAVPLFNALICGNGVVLKPSEFTFKTAEKLRDLAAECGIDWNLITLVSGDKSSGEAIVKSQSTSLICFTGSTAAGISVAKTCASMLKPCILELGGKDPMIILRDADLERAVNAAVWGSLHNCGQTCIAVERIFVEEEIYDKFVEMATDRIRKLKFANHADIGFMVSPAQVKKVEEQVKDAVSKGARCLHGGKADIAKGYIHEPTLLVDLNYSMMIMNEETFGPVIAVMKVKDENEALEYANKSRYGLGAYIFSKNVKKARKLALKVESGSVCINDVDVNYVISSLPFGGFKESGMGKVQGPEGIRSYVRQQAVTIDKLKLKKELWWYPYTDNTYKLLRKFIKTVWR
jgi:acyl-CoA reductase-like NAD-dependent aldehyde dehydrogenase